MKKWIFGLLCMAILTFCCAGCGDNDKVTKIRLSETRICLLTNDEGIDLEGEIVPIGLENIDVEWTADDDGIVEIAAETKVNSGAICAHIVPKSAGVTTLRATTKNGQSAACEITVRKPIPVESVTISPEEIHLLIGKREWLTAETLPANADQAELTWETSNAQIVTVTQQGSIVGKSAGSAVITASTKNGVQAKCTVVIEEMTEEKLEAYLAQQPAYVTSAYVGVQSTQWKWLYPDLLQAIIVNQGSDNIKNAVVAFAAWDSNYMPVIIEPMYNYFGSDAYVAQVNYDTINLPPGQSFGSEGGFQLHPDNQRPIAQCKACVVQYTTYDGKTWMNPYYKAFLELYEGKPLL